MSPILPALLRWRTRVGRGEVWVLLAAGLVGVGIAWPWVNRAGEKLVRVYQSWRVERWLNSASEAERTGQYHAAEIALATARLIDPENPTVQLRHADLLLLRMGRREEGLAEWRRLVASADRSAAEAVALLLATRLITVGEFRELAPLATHQLHHGDRNSGLWLNLAAEAYALAGIAPPADSLAALPRSGFGSSLAGYVLARLHRAEAAREALGRLGNGLLPPPVALLAARAHVELGDYEQAHAMLARNNQVLRPEEIITLELLPGGRQAGLAPFAVEQLFPARALPADIERRLALFVLHGLRWPVPAAANALGERLRGREPRLSQTALAALWLYAGRAREEAQERFWRERLAARIGTTLPRLDDGAPSAALLRIIVERAPLPLEMICGLMALIEVPAQATLRPPGT